MTVSIRVVKLYLKWLKFFKKDGQLRTGSVRTREFHCWLSGETHKQLKAEYQALIKEAIKIQPPHVNNVGLVFSKTWWEALNMNCPDYFDELKVTD